MDNPEKYQYRILSLASGLRGIERGIESTGLPIRTIAYVEIEAFIIANLVAEMETNRLAPAPIWSDIKTFDGKLFYNKVDIITGGYPCQPFSIAGQRKGSDDPRHIFPYILRIIEDTAAPILFFENVPGHLSLGFGEVYRSLRDLGYKVEAGLFSANEVGAPHKRQRLFILAIKMEYSNAAKIKDIIFRNTQKFSNFRSTNISLANSNYFYTGRNCGNIQESSNEIKTKTQRENRKRSRTEFSDSHQNVSDTNLYGGSKGKQKVKSNIFDQNVLKWPAPPGEFPYDWEEPRAIKSGMGCTVDGYNFRIDLLRALGNGVVPQTASIAFKSLIQKY